MARNVKIQPMLNDDELLIQRAYKYRCYPHQEQLPFFNQSFGHRRFVYNYFSNIQMERQEQGLKFLTNDQMDKALTSLKKEKTFLKDVNAQSLQSTTKDVKRAIDTFFQKMKKGEKSKAFNFKRKNEDKQSFSFPCNKNNIKFIHDYKIDKKAKMVYLSIPKLKTPLKVLKHRNWEGKITSVTISKEIDDYYVSIQTEQVIKKPEINAEPSFVGIDKGVIKLVTLHNGDYFEPINTYKKHQQQLAKLQRQIAIKEPFNQQQKKAFNQQKEGNESIDNLYFTPSNNYRKLQKQIKTLHRKMKRIRHEYLHVISSYLSNNHTYIMMEDLNTKNMTKSAKGTMEKPGTNVQRKSNLNKAILDQGWGILKEFTTYKSQWNNKILTLVPPAFTSQRCSSCDHVHTNNRESQSLFVCKSCGITMHADVNAALNVLRDGLRILHFDEAEIIRILSPWAKGELAKPVAIASHGSSFQAHSCQPLTVKANTNACG